MKPSNRLGLLVSLFVVIVAPAGASGQDTVTAEALFNKGVAEMKAGHYDIGCPALAESQRLDPRPGTLFTLAECYTQADKTASAVVAYEDFLRAVSAVPQAQRARYLERVKVADSRKATLKPQMPHLTVILPKNAPASLRVKRDGTELTAPMLGISLPLDPGEHVLVVEVPGLGSSEQRFTIKKGETQTVELSLPVAKTEEDKPPMQDGAKDDAPMSTSDTGSGRKIGFYVAGGLGVAGLLLGGVTGGIAVANKSTADGHCTKFVCDDKGLSAVENGRTMGLLSTIGLSVGVAGVATAVALWVTRPAEKANTKNGHTVFADVVVAKAGTIISIKGDF